MSLSDITSMTNSNSLRNRLTAAAARYGKGAEAQKWVHANNYALCATEGWDTKWNYATEEDPDRRNRLVDTGARTDVIDDDMIAAAVQALIAAQAEVAE